MKFSKTEVDAIIEASPRTFVPFNKLLLSAGLVTEPVKMIRPCLFPASLMIARISAFLSLAFSRRVAIASSASATAT